MIDIEAHIIQLRHGLFGTNRVSRGANRIRGAAGNDVRFFTGFRQGIGFFTHFGHHVGTAGNDTDAFDVKQLKKKIVSAGLRLVGALYPLFKDKVTIEAFFGGPGRRKSGMVRLDGTAGG